MANPQLRIENGLILSFNYASESFGTDYRFGRRKNITIQCAEIDFNGAQHKIGDCAKEIDSLIDTADYCSITINGVQISEQAKLTSFSIEEGDWTQVTKGRIGLVIFEQGNLAEQGYFPDEGFEGIKDLDKDSLAYIESFSEDFSFSTGANSVSYNHNIDLKFSENVGANNPNGESPAINAAINVCTKLMKEEGPAFDWLMEINFQGLYAKKKYKRYFTENIDHINNTVSISEKFEALNIAQGEIPYSMEAKQSLSLAEDGNITVSEKGTISSLELMEPGEPLKEFSYAEIGLETEVQNAVAEEGRLQGIFKSYKDTLSTCGEGDGEEEDDCKESIPDLVLDEEGTNVLKIKFGVTRNEFTGEISYEIEGTNDPKYVDGVIHEYTRTIRGVNFEGTNANGLYWLEIEENGDFVGNGKKYEFVGDPPEMWYPAYEKAYAAWGADRANIKTTLKEMIGVELEQYHIAFSVKNSFYQGSFSYSISYGDHPKYGTTNTPWKMLTYDDVQSLTEEGDIVGIGGGVTKWIHQNNVFDVYGHRASIQIAQKRSTRELTSSSQKIEAIGKRCTTWKELSEGIVNKGIFKPGPEAMFLSSCGLSFNAHNDKKMTISLDWR